MTILSERNAITLTMTKTVHSQMLDVNLHMKSQKNAHSVQNARENFASSNIGGKYVQCVNQISKLERKSSNVLSAINLFAKPVQRKPILVTIFSHAPYVYDL